MKKLFSIKHGRLGWLRALWRQPTLRYLYAQARRHRDAGRRQVAIFAFEHVGQSIELDGVYELAELEALFAWTEATSPGAFKQAVALDIGANIGNHSLFFSDYFARVISFEPSAQTFRLLEYNASLVSNVRCHNFGLSDADGEAHFAVHGSNRGANQISPTAEGAGERVRLRRLDGVEGIEGDIKLIKVDVEGHEPAVLRGAEALIRRYPRLGPRWPIRLRIVVDGFLRALVGEEMRVTVEEELAPDFYHMIVAIPDWFETPKG